MRHEVRQCFVLTAYGLKARYRGQILGLLWVVAYPALLFLVQWQVFSAFVPSNNKFEYGVFLLFGILPWTFFSQSFDMTCASLVFNSGPIKTGVVTGWQTVLIPIVENFITLLLSMAFLASFFLSRMHIDILRLIAFAIALAIFFIFTFSFCLISATVHVVFRDFKFVVSFLLQILFFLTPIIYETDQLRKSLASPIMDLIWKINPMAHGLASLRVWHSGWEWSGWSSNAAIFAIWSAALSVVQIAVWRRMGKGVYFAS